MAADAAQVAIMRTKDKSGRPRHLSCSAKAGANKVRRHDLIFTGAASAGLILGGIDHRLT
jgi:hypothetical protein